MTPMHWHPFREALPVRQAMERLLDDAFVQAGRRSHAEHAEEERGFELDLAEHDDALEVTACLPGLKPEDINIAVQGTLLTIEGELREAHQQRQNRSPLQEDRHTIHEQARDASTDRPGEGRDHDPREHLRGRSPWRGQPRYHHRERHYGRYVRSITLPVEVNADQADAFFEHGVLTIMLPKAEQARRRRIEVTNVGAPQQRASGELETPERATGERASQQPANP